MSFENSNNETNNRNDETIEKKRREKKYTHQNDISVFDTGTMMNGKIDTGWKYHFY